jgi:hypothetical protein|tara:strand:- start:62640 stop:63041 length:402 start_codon:yes stop_codon:yes gene_type:complete
MEEKYRVIIAGGRDFDDFRKLSSVCMHMLQNKMNIEIVSGTANGADKLGEQFAKFAGHSVKQFPASWDELGKAAGFIRNKEMAEYADAAIIFWDKSSKGTKHMIDLANKMNLKVKLVIYSNEVIKDDIKEWWQ